MKIVALLNCHGDDVYCFRKEVIDALVENGYKVILSCPESHRLDCFRNNENIIIEDIIIDRRGTNPIKDIRYFPFPLGSFSAVPVLPPMV